MNILGIIPARYASTRFPGKPLALIAGKPVLQHTVEQCRQARALSEVIVATDDERIARVASGWCQVEMTRPDHVSGTDRVAEVAARRTCNAVVNIQGDEPLVDPAVIDAVAQALTEADMSTAATPIRDAAMLANPAVVKVVVGLDGHALYFSRSLIPYPREGGEPRFPPQAPRHLRHLGIYGYRREALLRVVGWPVSPLEAAEKLEQLRALENGLPIRVVLVEDEGIGVDTPDDVARVEALLERRGAGSLPATNATSV
ncbi:MAG: 3-deoxy-manno-octulosonate cytidylyltransferase [Verrucomicrobia bacterium]|nr:3-deoxy-manno-octulosonate cytidylyltransferase [Verrucomicrobiota bacterium]